MPAAKNRRAACVSLPVHCTANDWDLVFLRRFSCGEAIIMRTCRPVGPERLLADCRNAAQCESLGHRPRNRFISNAKALKGRNWGRATSFRPLGAVCVSNHFSQGDALGFHILGLWPGTHSAAQCSKLSRPLTASDLRLLISGPLRVDFSTMSR